jgi:HlyD family secretion protein
MAISTKEDEDRTSKFAAVLKDAVTGGAAPPPPRRRRGLPRWVTMGTVTVIILAMVAAGVRSSLLTPAAVGHNVLTEKVHRSDLVVSITEDGNVESAHNKDIKCEVQGGGVILWLIKDGSLVKKGDELARLDSSTIEDKINQEKITYEKARATMIEAQKNFDAAKIAVLEYVEGTFAQSLQDLKAKATVAKENLESAKNLLVFTNKMARQGYVTTLQRDAQAFAVQRSELDLGVAETAITVLEKFTKPKTQSQLESTRDSAEAKMAAEKAAFALEEDRLKRLEIQLEKCTIIAPDDGMVVYANEQQDRRSGSSQQSMVEEGAMMRERQSIIKLPDLSRMQVKSTVHESKVDYLKRGMRARIRIQDHEYQGVVTSIANQPEPTNFFSGTVKEYAAVVSIDSDPHGLRPGMTAAVEILVANLPNVLSVPVQAVVEKGGKFYAWVEEAAGPAKRPVVLGMSNNTRIEIKDGLTEGQLLLLNPRATIEEARDEEKAEEKIDVKKKFGDDKPAAVPVATTGPPATEAGGDKAAGDKAAGDKGKKRGTFDLMSFDKDGDKKISKDEAPDQVKGFFDRMDSNSDGFIDAKEIAEARQKAQQMKQQMQGGAP